MKAPSIAFALVLCGTALLHGCSAEKAGGPAKSTSPAYAGDAKGLEKLMRDLLVAQREDTKKAAELTRGLLPDRAKVVLGLAKDAPKEDLDAILATFAKVGGAPDETMAQVLKPGDPKRTEVQVHAATTEELVAKTGPGVAEFPGGVLEAAKSGLLRPGATYYEVEFLEPGKDSGMKYHMFFHDGSSWTMLGKVWRK